MIAMIEALSEAQIYPYMFLIVVGSLIFGAFDNYKK